MAGSGNTLNFHNDSRYEFDRMFVSAYDGGGGSNNVVNQHAGNVTANGLWLGTYTLDFSQNTSQYNLYGGSFAVNAMRIQTDDTTITTMGRGEANIYGGMFTANSLTGGQSVSGGVTYRGDIDIHLSEKSVAGFGTFGVTGNSSYKGNVTVSVDAPILTLSPDVVGKNLVHFAGDVDTNMQLTTNSSLISISDDRKTARLDASKDVTPVDGYVVGGSLSFAEAVTGGYLRIEPSDDPYTMLLTTTEFANEEAIDAFADWLNANVENYSVTPAGLDGLQIETFTTGSGSVFLWDFSDYTSGNVGVWGISTRHVPEPHTWILALLGIILYWGKFYAKKRVYAG